MQTHLRGRDMITTQEWTKSEIDTIIDVALDLKRKRAMGMPHAIARVQRGIIRHGYARMAGGPAMSRGNTGS